MNLYDLRQLFRLRSDDTKKKYLWGDDEVNGYINLAYFEAVRRAYLIADNETPEVCHIDVAAGEALYKLHPSILRIREDTVTLDDKHLEMISIQDAQHIYGDYWNSTQLFPEFFSVDAKSGYIQLIHTPDANGSMNFGVYRMPMAELVDDGDEPEIEGRYHVKLIHHALELAYLKQDVDTYDPNKSRTQAALFIQEFGQPINAHQERANRTRTRRGNRAVWF
jgi:hypothetical protein